MVTTHSLLRINSCNRFLWPLAWHILVNFPQGVLTCSQDWEPLLSRFSHVQLCVTPETAAHQAPPFPGLSRQEHWSGLPFPPPMHESEKWKWSHSVVSNPKRPHGLQPTRLLRPWDFPGKSTGVGCHCLLWIGYYSAIKRNEIISFAETWMDLEMVIQSEVSQKEKNKYYVLMHICEI